jgi:hypothetical protein
MQPSHPIVILALPRSYSSLTCAMLGQHPQLYDLLETQLFEVDTMQMWWQRYGKNDHDGDGLTRVVAEVVFGGQSPLAASLARHWLRARRKWQTKEMFGFLLEALAPLTPVEKNPLEDATSVGVQQKLVRRRESVPEACFIHLTRHPVSYGLSHLKHLRTMGKSTDPVRMLRRYQMMVDKNERNPSVSVVDPQVLWYRVNAGILEFLETHPGVSYIRIRSEDLLSRPTVQLRRITRYLGIRDDERAIACMTHPERSPFACLGPRNARFGGDPAFFSSPAFRRKVPPSAPLDRPLPWRHDRGRFCPWVVELAGRLGYA